MWDLRLHVECFRGGLSKVKILGRGLRIEVDIKCFTVQDFAHSSFTLETDLYRKKKLL